ncbi:MAG TPA: DUF952 domain-containing protein [Actinomycetota bacterium]|nr:DUF952 domain-containing protein [Actinomycetota bacterium]
MIFHLTTRAAWDEAARVGGYRADTLATEGFIHCSSGDQVADVANVRFRGQDDLVLLWIDPARVRAEIKYEEASDGSGVFPHIYGELNTDAVARVTDYAEIDGSFPSPT